MNGCSFASVIQQWAFIDLVTCCYFAGMLFGFTFGFGGCNSSSLSREHVYVCFEGQVGKRHILLTVLDCGRILFCFAEYVIVLFLPSCFLSFLPVSLPSVLFSFHLSFSSFHFFSPFPPSLYFLSFCPSLFLPFLLSFIPTAY